MQHDLELLRKSRIQSLETALAGELPLAHQNVVQHAFKAEVNELLARVQSSLQSRQENLRRQRDDLISIYQRFIEEHEFRQPVPGPLALESIVCKSTGWRKSSTSASAPCCAC